MASKQGWRVEQRIRMERWIW